MTVRRRLPASTISQDSCAALFRLGSLSLPASCSPVSKGTGQTGAPCGDLDFVCASDDCESGYCAAPSCRTGSCPTGQYCDPPSLGRVPGSRPASRCTYNAECDPSVVCRAGSCGAPLPDQSARPQDTDCVSGACISSRRARLLGRPAASRSPTVCPASAPPSAPATAATRPRPGSTSVVRLSAPGPESGNWEGSVCSDRWYPRLCEGRFDIPVSPGSQPRRFVGGARSSRALQRRAACISSTCGPMRMLKDVNPKQSGRTDPVASAVDGRVGGGRRRHTFRM